MVGLARESGGEREPSVDTSVAAPTVKACITPCALGRGRQTTGGVNEGGWCEGDAERAGTGRGITGSRRTEKGHGGGGRCVGRKGRVEKGAGGDGVERRQGKRNRGDRKTVSMETRKETLSASCATRTSSALSQGVIRIFSSLPYTA